ncbi:Alkaline phosphatase D precursor [Anatilimnocola aggregata]|uniref:Alkaline phosphatase D n=1 Tax=Anatilimnocola aggregata TaxID=2528021 RepID=A0A517YHR6_9BACT|nr:alkaline phosphatase D family protein [Anatilimnocola aggregata]QDU29761.1 Alkaline phosphatase D precursor [Anatilimnocola aggregata]
MSDSLSRRSFVIGSGAALAATANSAALASAAAKELGVLGPLVGHVGAQTAILWARIPIAGRYALELATTEPDSVPLEEIGDFFAKTDFTGRWRFEELRPSTTYRYRLVPSAKLGGLEIEGTFRTAPHQDLKTKVSLAFGSCATEDEGSRSVWRRIRAEKVDGLILCGDTPYIDSTDLTKQRQRYREFSAVEEFQDIARTIPVWGTWDDHDFGKNDADGRLRGKENARQAFTEYRALSNFGDGKTGIYTCFRYGPVEVFVIDARWFANTEPSPVEPNKSTLLGAAQWEWLKAGLKSSTAPWKVLATGMIWDAKLNGEKDHWEFYAHERRAIFDFIRAERIGGVVLLGGDIHVSRALRYAAENTVGYPLYQFITSPIHHRVIPALNNEHPDLLFSAVKPHTFLKLTCDATGPDPQLTARFLNRDGELLFDEITLSLKDISHPA